MAAVRLVFILPIPTDEAFRTWRRRAPAAWTLVGLNAAVFLFTLQDPKPYLNHYGFVPASPSALTACTSMFLHAGWLHIIGNMFFLLIFGRPVEHAIGTLKFALSYVLCGIAALGVHAVVTASPAVPVVGASGAISGAVGMFVALFPRAPVDLHAYVGYWHIKTWQSTGLVATGVWFLEQLGLALLTSATGIGLGVAFWGHVGGFVCGVLTALASSRLAFGYPDAKTVSRRDSWK